MKRVGIQLSVVFALTANLLLPQQIVSYRPCCYDQDGKLALHQCGCPDSGNEPSITERHECCEPIITQLLHGGATQTVVAASVKSPAPTQGALPVAPVKFDLSTHEAPAAVVFYDTGPPMLVGFLKLHSRFNI